MTPFELAHIVRRQGRQFRQRHMPTERTQRMATTDTTTSTTITAMADGCEAAISDQGATMPDWEEIAKWHLEGIREQATALAAQVERLQHLWDTWQRSRGYDTGSKPFATFLAALKACEDHGDLLPLDDGSE